MKRSSFLSVLAFGALVICAHPLTARAQAQIQLTAHILGQTFCSVNGDEISLALKIKLRYTNISSRPVILYKGHDLFFQTKIRRDEDLPGKSYLVHLLNMHYFDEEFERIDARSPGRVFVTLAPNQSFERELIKGVGVVEDSKERSATSVKPGPHTLQLIVSTWYQSPKLAEQLRVKWQRRGYLWSQPLASVPLALDIKKPGTAPPCR